MRLIDADSLMAECQKLLKHKKNPNWNDAMTLIGLEPTIQPEHTTEPVKAVENRE